MQEPVLCWHFPAFDFHATLAGMLGPTLIRHQVVQVGQPRQKRLLTTTGLVKPFHREQFPVDGVVGLNEQGAGHRHLGVFEHRGEREPTPRQYGDQTLAVKRTDYAIEGHRRDMIEDGHRVPN
jgi:hypothetical protein